MNSVSPGTAGNFPPTQSAFACSMRSFELETKFHQMWRWRFSRRLQSEVIVAPDGGKWRVRDEELAQHSDVQLRAWEQVWIGRWQPVDALALDACIGRRFDTDLRYLLQDGSSAYVEVPDTSFFGFSVTGRF